LLGGSSLALLRSRRILADHQGVKAWSDEIDIFARQNVEPEATPRHDGAPIFAVASQAQMIKMGCRLSW